MESRIKYGVFWHPESELKEYILYWKKKVEELESDATYLNHPVHSTFYLFMAENNRLEEIQEQFMLLSEKLNKINLTIEGWHIFDKDLATGGDTLTIRIGLSEKLLEIQQIIAETLYPFINGKVDYPVVWPGILGDSYKRWGFPFVGPHWIPHISIASLKLKGKSVIKEALSNDYPKNSVLEQLSLVEINGDHHKIIKNIILV